jgi:hypothetical protein
MQTLEDRNLKINLTYLLLTVNNDEQNIALNHDTLTHSL